LAYAKVNGKRPTKDMKQAKRAQNPSKIPNFYASQKYPNIYRPPKIGHSNKSLKITQN
jgi:hypothetical protein